MAVKIGVNFHNHYAVCYNMSSFANNSTNNMHNVIALTKYALHRMRK